MNKRIVIFLLASMLGFGESIADIEQKTEELNAVQSGIQSIWQKLKSIQLQKKTAQSELEDTEKRYGEIAALLHSLNGQIAQKRQNLGNIHQEIAQYQDQISSQSKVLAGQMRAAHAMGKKERLKLMLNQQDPALSGRMLVYYEYLSRERVKKLTGIKATLQSLDQLDQQKQLEAEALTQDLEKIKAERLELDKVRKERNELLAQLGKEVTSNEQALRRLKESESKLQNLIASLQHASGEDAFEAETATPANKLDERSVHQDGYEVEQTGVKQKDALVVRQTDSVRVKGDFSALKGKLSWPVQGRLVQKFGSPRLESRWDGVLIDAKEGTAIRAVNSGKVVYAQWLRGYGLLTIIDHGKGYMTLYAFNQSLYKNTGDWVESGDVIASVGQSGGRSQSGLYFGIRKKGIPVDPLQWCRN